MLTIRSIQNKSVIFFIILLVGILTWISFYPYQHQFVRNPIRSDEVDVNHFHFHVNSSKYVIYICDKKNLCGGYGDRQKGIVASYLISVMMNRQFGIIHHTPCDIGQVFQPNLINWKVDETIVKTKTTRRVTAIDGKSNQLRKSMMKMDMEKEFKEDVLYFSLNLEYVYYLRQNKKYERQLKWLEHLSISEIYYVVWNRLFKLKPIIQDQLEPFIKLKNQGIKLIGAQIRLGRNPTIPNDSDIRNTLNNTKVLWKFYQKYNDSSKYRIFISTDSYQVHEEAKVIFPDVYTSIPGKVVHIERTKSNDVCIGWNKVVLDQVVLSLSDVLVISNSGFGRIAAFLRQNENDLFCLRLDQIYRCTTQSRNFDVKSLE